MKVDRQRTVARESSFEGHGIHTGARVTVRFLPSEAGSGVAFVRCDLPGEPRIPVDPQWVVEREGQIRRTTLCREGAEVNTVEHVLACVAGLGIDNLTMELDGPEVPEPADGSAEGLARALQEAGLREQSEPRHYFSLRRTHIFERGPVSLVAIPYDGLKLSYTLQYDNPVLGTQHLSLDVTTDSFLNQIARARTFALYEEVDHLRSLGLIKGGTLSNAIVVKGEEVLSEEPLRYPDEFVRHKVLDLLGDLFLLGRPLRAHVIAVRSGHSTNRRFVRQLWEESEGLSFYDDLRQKTHFDIQSVTRIMPHRYPFLLVDRILYLEERKRVVGLKNVTINEPFFHGHFPGHPVMPAVLIIEAMAQVGGVLLLHTVDDPDGKLVYFMGIDRAKFRRPVQPGDQLIFDLRMVRLKSRICKMAGKCLVDGQVVAEAELLSSIVDR